jgi:hypothetical protein
MMAATEKMTIDEVYKYLRQMRSRYAQANRARKGELLTEMEAVTGRHRKSLIRLLGGPLERRPRKRQRRRTYQSDFDQVLKRISESYGHICAERLHPTLLALAEQLARHGEVTLTEKLRQQLASVSLTTVSDHLRRMRQDEPWTPRRKTRSPHPFLQNIPMCRLPWDIAQPGYFEVDLVHHCGQSARGEYVHTLQMIDVFSGWSERTALLGRSYRVMEAGFQRLLDRLPFPICGLHPDNGSEFFNHHMLRFWKAHPHVEISRSRPYRKNDNRFVEQKNSSLVRAYTGDIRLDTVAQTRALERLYRSLWLFNNCFQPSLRLINKEHLPQEDGHSARIRRRYSAHTAWHRICQAGVLPTDQQHLLQACIDATNPRSLSAMVDALCSQLYNLPPKLSDEPENVYETLSES